MLLRAELFSALVLTIGMGMVLQGTTDAPAQATADFDVHTDVSFSEQIMPIFEARCTECHGTNNAELGLNLSTYEGTMAGSDYGTVVEPGNPDASLLVDMIASGDMPRPSSVTSITTWLPRW